MKITSLGVNQGSLVKLLKALRNRCFDNAGLAQGTTTTRVKTTNTVKYMIDGTLYSKSAEDNITIASLTATAASQTSRVRVEVNSAGTVSFSQGPVVSTAAPAGAVVAGPRGDSKATLGYFDLPASFTPNTTTTDGLTYVDGDPDLNTDALEV